jgi:hypothetical protein
VPPRLCLDGATPTVGVMPDVDIWDIYNRVGQLDRAAMNAAKRGILAVCDLRSEVNSGGFDSYFRYWGGNTAPDALTVLPALLGQAWADLLSEAMSLLGPQYPIEPTARERWLTTRDLDDQLGDLDTRYFALEINTDGDARLNAYVARNPDVMA